MLSQIRPTVSWHSRHGVDNYLRCFICLLCLFSTQLFADENKTGVDAVLIMDSSGSMAKNDPKKLRVPAAKLFMSLLREEDRVGLVSFSDSGYPVLKLTPPIPGKMRKILKAADKVTSKGVYTNIHDALNKGIAMLDKSGNNDQEKMLVLMSDGKMDVGDKAKDERLTFDVRDTITKTLKEKNIKVYTIAFTESSDVELMQHLADETGALYRLAQNDKDLHEVFAAIFETAKNPDMLPVEGGEFTVDKSIEEVTLVASKENSRAQVYLQTPDGKKLRSKNAKNNKNLKWFASHHFDMITIKYPQPGTWKLLSTSGKNRAYIVTNMSLHHNSQELKLDKNSDMVIEAWLEEDGKLLDREAILTGTEFYLAIEDPDGATAEFNLFDNGEYGDRKAADGHYSNTLAYENPGAYRLSLRAIGETFKREKIINFNIATPQEGADEHPAPEPEPELEPVPETEPVSEPEITPEVSEEPVDKKPEDPKPEAIEKDDEGMGVGAVVGIFMGINLLLGLIGAGIWWILKRRNKPAESEEETDLEEAGEEQVPAT